MQVDFFGEWQEEVYLFMEPYDTSLHGLLCSWTCCGEGQTEGPRAYSYTERGIILHL
jgi:hypothetical protein